MSFDAWKDANVVPSRDRIVIVAPKSTFKAETVSTRLAGQLVHPNKPQWLSKLAWSPDGKRIIASEPHGGVVQVWEVASGRPLSKFEIGAGYRISGGDFQLSPDWKTIFVAREKRKHSRIEMDGQEAVRLDYDGDVRAFDLESGALLETYRHSPPRGIWALMLSPDGATMATSENLSAEYTARGDSPKRAMGFWDIKTKEYRELPGQISALGIFSPDNKFVAIDVTDNGSTSEIRFVEVASLKTACTIPIDRQFSRVQISTFSPDGRMVFGHYQTFPGKNKWDTWESGMAVWEVPSGREVATFAMEDKDSGYSLPVFSPDGRTTANTNWRGKEGKLYMFDIDGPKLTKTISLGEKTMAFQPAFSPDGRWLAVPTQVFPDENDRDPKPEDLPQPRIQLVEIATGIVRETIIGPPATISKVAFSPDGKTLATDGNGKVLLWDMTKPIGGESAK